ncbi:MAG: hypothetical protein ACI37Z_09060 [Candidatus Gastranaerophilaceae bacterium]
MILRDNRTKYIDKKIFLADTKRHSGKERSSKSCEADAKILAEADKE